MKDNLTKAKESGVEMSASNKSAPYVDPETSYGVTNLPSDNINNVIRNQYQTEFVERQLAAEKLRQE